jgi:hypothetical protein
VEGVELPGQPRAERFTYQPRGHGAHLFSIFFLNIRFRTVFVSLFGCCVVAKRLEAPAADVVAV